MKCIRLCGILVGCVSVMVQANIGNIKGTYDILKDEYKEFSIIHGAVAWETGTIRRMYDFGPLGKEINAAGKHDVKNIDSKTIQLLSNLFYRRPGTTSVAEFVVTKLIRELSDVVVAEFVAEVVWYLKQLPESDAFKAYKKSWLFLQQPVTREVAQVAAKTGKIMPEAASPAHIKLEKSETLPVKSITPEKMKVIFKKELEDARSKLVNEFIKSKEFAGRDKVLKDLGRYILNAYLECAVEQYMPAYVPHIILQALLYAKSRGSKEAFMRYYQRLDENVQQSPHKSSILNSEVDWSVWQKDVFSLQQLVGIEEEFSNRTITLENINRFYEKAVFFFCVPRNFPPEITYSEFPVSLQGVMVKLTDCMESAMRNYINLLSYDPDAKVFSGNLLEKRLGTTSHSSLKNFYADYPASFDAGDTKVHVAWAQNVISNIPYVSYVRVTGDTKLNNRGMGFITGIATENQELMQFLDERGYQVASEGGFAYEINPSIKNIIIASDYLLGLQLFEIEPLSKAFLREDFIKKYLPKLAEKLKTYVPKEFDLESIDKRDYTSEKIKLMFSFSFDDYNPAGSFTTFSGHGEFKQIVGAKKTVSFLEDHYKHNKHSESRPLSLPLIIDKDICKDTPELFFWFFSHRIESGDVTFALLENSFQFNNVLAEFFIFFAKKQPDVVRKLEMFYKLVLNNFAFYEATMEALKYRKSEDNRIKKEVSSLLRELFGYGSDTKLEYFFEKLDSFVGSRDQFYEELSSIAIKDVQDKDSPLRVFLIYLFEKLVDNGRAYQGAMQAADLAANIDEAMRAVKLFEKLVQKGQAYKEAHEFLKKNIAKLDKDRLFELLPLAELLVKSGHAYKEAGFIARESVSFKVNMNDAILLLRQLVEKGYAYQDAALAASKGVEYFDLKTQKLAFSLFEKLIEKEQAYEEALSVSLKDEGWDLKDSQFLLLAKLVEKGQVYQEATRVAVKEAGTLSPDRVKRVIPLFEKLIEKGQAYNEAEEFLKSLQLKIKLVLNSELTEVIYSLLEKLVKKGLALQEAGVVSRLWKKSNDISAKGFAETLDLLISQHKIAE